MPTRAANVSFRSTAAPLAWACERRNDLLTTQASERLSRNYQIDRRSPEQGTGQPFPYRLLQLFQYQAERLGREARRQRRHAVRLADHLRDIERQVDEGGLRLDAQALG